MSSSLDQLAAALNGSKKTGRRVGVSFTSGAQQRINCIAEVVEANAFSFRVAGRGFEVEIDLKLTESVDRRDDGMFRILASEYECFVLTAA